MASVTSWKYVVFAMVIAIVKLCFLLSLKQDICSSDPPLFFAYGYSSLCCSEVVYACTSTVSNTSLDCPLLVPNGTYIFTAGSCVMCNCDAANNFVLHCVPFQRRPFQIRSSLWPSSCPSMQCLAGDNLYIGNTTSSSCNRTTCAYAGYTNQTILKTLALDSTCPGLLSLASSCNSI